LSFPLAAIALLSEVKQTSGEQSKYDAIDPYATSTIDFDEFRSTFRGTFSGHKKSVVR